MHWCRPLTSSETIVMPLTLAGSPLQACDSRFDAPSGFVRRNSQRADDGISQVELASQQGPTRLIPTHTKCGKQCGSAFFRKPTLSCKNNTIKRLTGAQKRTRTSTALRPLAPEASASTNSTTWAQGDEFVARERGRAVTAAVAACQCAARAAWAVFIHGQYAGRLRWSKR